MCVGAALCAALQLCPRTPWGRRLGPAAAALGLAGAFLGAVPDGAHPWGLFPPFLKTAARIDPALGVDPGLFWNGVGALLVVTAALLHRRLRRPLAGARGLWFGGIAFP